MQLTTVAIEKPEEMNIILGMSHFIRTVEDLHEAMVTSTPGVKFGLAFCEASQDRLVRVSGTDEELIQLAARNMMAIGAGHTFLIMLAEGVVFPIHVLRAIRQVPEVCRIFCASGNDVQVVLARSELGAGVLGVIDGQSPVGVEGPEDVERRKAFLRTIGLKL
jgi:adenosine/AMP kinase